MTLKPQLLVPIFALTLGITLLEQPRALAESSQKPTCNEVLKTPKTSFFAPKVDTTPDGRVQLFLSQNPGLLAKSTNYAASAALRPLFKIKKLEGAVRSLQAQLADPTLKDVPYFHKVEKAFQLSSKFNEEFLSEVPKTGPVLVTLNHPLSGLELLAVAATLQRVRPDVKVISTKFLEGMPGLIDNAILVDNMGGEAARLYNINQRELILESLRRGELLVISPAGAVSTKNKLSDQVAIDPPWKLGVADFIEKIPGTQVLPVYVAGGPSMAFHTARAIHPFAGTAMILREISEGIGSEIHFALSKPVSPEDLAKFQSKRELMTYLRARSYMLANGMNGANSRTAQSRQRKEDFAEAMPDEDIVNELMQQRVLYDIAPDSPDRGMMTFMAVGRDIPVVLQEVGRLREITFWGANEGTGMARDLDNYDPDYIHLIAWDKKQKRIAGAYRIGLTDQLVAARGISGTYIANQFGVEPLLQTRLARLVEIGRSFVLKEYQGRLALPALLGGVGRFLASHPQYEGFFGAVSVSDQYKEMSKALILKWAEMHEGAVEFGQVSSKNPPKFTTNLSNEELALLVKYATTVQDLNDLVSSSEGYPKAKAPQLIQIYKELGAKFLAFDKDSEFNTIDGLIFTSILRLSHEQRVQYMGVDGAQNFEAYWNILPAEVTP